MASFARHPSLTCLWRPFPWLLVTLTVLLMACAVQPSATSPKHPTLGAQNTIFVTSNGWHSSIVIARADLKSGRIPEVEDFPHARFLEFGWGDGEYYPAKDPTLAMTLRAAFVPTPALVHVAGLAVDPARFFAQSEVIALHIDDQNLDQLIEFFNESFERLGAARATATGPGLYATSRFYPATGRFHLGNTCNTWTARALAAARFDVRAPGTSRAEALMRQVRVLDRRPHSQIRP